MQQGSSWLPAVTRGALEAQVLCPRMVRGSSQFYVVPLMLLDHVSARQRVKERRKRMALRSRAGFSDHGGRSMAHVDDMGQGDDEQQEEQRIYRPGDEEHLLFVRCRQEQDAVTGHMVPAGQVTPTGDVEYTLFLTNFPPHFNQAHFTALLKYNLAIACTEDPTDTSSASTTTERHGEQAVTLKDGDLRFLVLPAKDVASSGMDDLRTEETYDADGREESAAAQDFIDRRGSGAGPACIAAGAAALTAAGHVPGQAMVPTTCRSTFFACGLVVTTSMMVIERLMTLTRWWEPPTSFVRALAEHDFRHKKAAAIASSDVSSIIGGKTKKKKKQKSQGKGHTLGGDAAAEHVLTAASMGAGSALDHGPWAATLPRGGLMRWLGLYAAQRGSLQEHGARASAIVRAYDGVVEQRRVAKERAALTPDADGFKAVRTTVHGRTGGRNGKRSRIRGVGKRLGDVLTDAERDKLLYKHAQKNLYQFQRAQQRQTEEDELRAAYAADVQLIQKRQAQRQEEEQAQLQQQGEQQRRRQSPLQADRDEDDSR